MAVNGVFASDSNIQGNRKGDFAGKLLQKVPTGKAPMLALTSGMEEAPAQDTVVTWFEEQHISGRVEGNLGFQRRRHIHRRQGPVVHRSEHDLRDRAFG